MKISVEGYKSISEKRTVDVDGLTILAGTNSSGKSSFMQPFLVLKQTVENSYETRFLQLYGENVKLTDSSQVISKVFDGPKGMFSVELESEKSACRISFKHKKGRGIEADSSYIRNSDMPQGFELTMLTKSLYIEESVPKKPFDSVKKNLSLKIK